MVMDAWITPYNAFNAIQDNYKFAKENNVYWFQYQRRNSNSDKNGVGFMNLAAYLDSMGVKELILVAQDVTRYGSDLGEYMLVPLVRRLLDECSFSVIRLMYCYPELVTDELIELISQEKRVASYIDVPLQHISDGVLKRMGRRTSSAQIKELFTKLKSRNIPRSSGWMAWSASTLKKSVP